jgi:uncharacterized protein
MDRRSFLRRAAIGAGAAALSPAYLGRVLTAPARAADGPYGPLLAPDANGIRLPAGFSSRVIARTGQPVGTTGYVWHLFPDGGATFATSDGGWIYVSNSEAPLAGGAGAVRFDAAGNIVGAHRILAGTSMNCAGGPTPWGTWLSCEEHDNGHVWECDPAGPGAPKLHRGLGTFSHEAAAFDTEGRVYLTEDKSDGRLYRFTPSSAAGTPASLEAGLLEAMTVDSGGAVGWLPVPNPNPLPNQTPTRQQVPGSAAFNGGEGAWFQSGHLYFTTKGDNRVWDLDVAVQHLSVLYDAATSPTPVLRGVDNIVGSSAGDLYVAEDGDDMQLVGLGPDGSVFPVLQVTPAQPLPSYGQSEITGPAFSPDGTRLYFSSQRGPYPGGFGITYEVTGPFRR